MTEDEIRDLLREMRDDPVPADSLVRVRYRVADRLRRRSRWTVAGWVIACAVTVVLAVFIGSQSHREPEHRASHVAVTRQQDVPAVQPLIRKLPPVKVRPAIRRTRKRIERESTPVMIRMETSDPDVVILLVSN